MYRFICFTISCFLLSTIWANDGAYYAKGNQLIPIVETDISVKKEVLTITRVSKEEVKVVVEYVFFNPTSAKELTVGFEAVSPFGDVDGTPKNGQHPYIRDFSVMMNAASIPYKAAIVTDKDYAKGMEISSQTVEEAMGEYFNENAPDFFYVYHFQALFQPGDNRIRHEYYFQLSSSVMNWYSFEYVLTAANRWANGQIDDFTLIIDMGPLQEFNLSKSFFTENSSWAGNGILQDGTINPDLDGKLPPLHVFSQDGPLTFKKMNFKPAGELYLYSPIDYEAISMEHFNSVVHELPYDLQDFLRIKRSLDETSFKILRNLPFARRGYVFQTQEIQAYYEARTWYRPNPDYVAKTDDLSEEELKWLQEVRANEWR